MRCGTRPRSRRPWLASGCVWASTALIGHGDVQLCYDGTRDGTLIRVTVAVREPVSGTRPITFPGADVAAVVRLGDRPVDTGDAWLVLDTELRRLGLAAVGPYRQTFHTDGSVTLAVPVSSAPPCADPEVGG